MSEALIKLKNQIEKRVEELEGQINDTRNKIDVACKLSFNLEVQSQNEKKNIFLDLKYLLNEVLELCVEMIEKQEGEE